MRLELVPSPLGDLLVVTDAIGAVVAADWEDHRDRMERLLTRYQGATTLKEHPGPPSPTAAALTCFFGGDVHAIDRLSVEAGGTAFQREVWGALRRIPAGSTTTYSALARQLGRPDAVRAVGAANAANPVSIIVPCHRVIGADGELRGYAGGLDRKRWLLSHEGATVPLQQESLF
jgi:methylated-DNA-[protein]-cysteine S-methyltransferase